MFTEFNWTDPDPLVLAFLLWMKFCEVLFRFFLEFGWGALKDAGLKLLQPLATPPPLPPPPSPETGKTRVSLSVETSLRAER